MCKFQPSDLWEKVSSQCSVLALNVLTLPVLIFTLLLFPLALPLNCQVLPRGQGLAGWECLLQRRCTWEMVGLGASYKARAVLLKPEENE